jgi:putative membrane protein
MAMWEWHMGSAWWWMCVVMLAFFGLVAGVVVSLVRQRDQGRPGTPSSQSTLDERCARGEINDDEYRRRSELIHSQAADQ